MKTTKNHLLTGSIILFFALAAVVRILCLPYLTGDMVPYLDWYGTLADKGFIQTYASGFSNYSPPFMYLLFFATLTKGLIPEITAIKLIPIIFDIVNAFIIYKIVKTKFSQGEIPKLAAAIFFLLPTVMINSSFWGQTDSLYTCFLLLTLYFIIVERSPLALAAFGIALSVKVQSIFLLPFLALLLLKRHIHWAAFALIPLAYFLAILPAVLSGMPVTDVLSIYRGQATTFYSLQMNAPNLYIFAPPIQLSTAVTGGIVFAFVFTCVWLFIFSRMKFQFSPTLLVYFALISVAFLPFILPKMHDRYFYPADVISLILAFFYPALWFIPVLYQIISGFSYTGYLFQYRDPFLFLTAIVLNTTVLIFLFWKQPGIIKELGMDPKN